MLDCVACKKKKQFLYRETLIFCTLFLVCLPFFCWFVVVLNKLFFIWETKKVVALRGNFEGGCFLHCTLHCTTYVLHPYAPSTSFRLRNKVECQCYNETNISPCQFKNTKSNMIINFVLCQVRFILFNTNLITISFMKTILKML